MTSRALTASEVLRLFIETTNELVASNYVKQARAGGVGSAIAFTNLGLVMARSGPPKEDVKAAVLTIRFLNQNNEATSFENVCALVETLPIDQDLKNQFVTARSDFNDHLAKAPAIAYPSGIGADTNGAIFDTFLYGALAHRNVAKMRRIEEWAKQPYFNNLRSQFDLTMLLFIAAAAKLSKIAEKILASVEANQE